MTMAARDKFSKHVRPQLEEGEVLQAAFPAQGGLSPNVLVLTGYLLAFWLAKYVVIAVTDRRIAVFKAGPLATGKAKELLGSFPRETRLGPVSGLWGKIELGGTRYYVHRRFHADVRAVDAPPGASVSAPAYS
jgi:hypothetical protein